MQHTNVDNKVVQKEEMNSETAKSPPCEDDAIWGKRFKELQAFKQNAGYANPTFGPLADWVAQQRDLHLKKGLKPQQIQMLRDIGCSGFEEKKPVAKAETPPKSNPPKATTNTAATTAGPALAQVVGVSPINNPVAQKYDNPAEAVVATPLLDQQPPDPSKGAPTPLQAAPKKQSEQRSATTPKVIHTAGTTATIQSLIDGVEDPQEKEYLASWEARFQDLMAFQRLFGHANPTFHTNKFDRQQQGTRQAVNDLSVWLEYQRTFFRQGIRLSAIQIQMLVDIGTDGFAKGVEQQQQQQQQQQQAGQQHDDDPHLVYWFFHFLALRGFKAKMGHTNPRREGTKTPVGEKQLADWLGSQREAFQNDTCPFPDQIAMLRELGCAGFEKGVPFTQERDDRVEPKSSNVVTPTEGARMSVRNDGVAPSPSIVQGVGSNPPADHSTPTPRAAPSTTATNNAIAAPKIAASSSTRSSGSPSSAKRKSAQVPMETKIREDGDSNKAFVPQQTTTQSELTLAWKTKLRELETLMGPDHEREGIAQLNDNDVVCWEEGHVGYDIIYGMLPGNIQFGSVVSQEEKKYNLRNKQNVVEVAGQVVSRIRRMDPPGRFLNKGEDGLWYDAGNVDAIKEALRALRERTRALQQSEAGNNDDSASLEGDGAEPSQVEVDVEMDNSAEMEESEVEETSPPNDVEMADNVETLPNFMIKPSVAAWEARFRELETYKAENGHANPNKSKTSPDYKMGCWLSDQRRSHRNGRLNHDRTERLRNLGCIGFETNDETRYLRQNDIDVVHVEIDAPQDDGSSQADQEQRPKEKSSLHAMMIWNNKYEQLKAYKLKSGNPNPRESKKVSANSAEHKLGRWLRDQRLKLRTGKLTKDLVEKLHALGCIGFENSDGCPDPPKQKPHAVPWETQFLKLCGYKEKRGHANPTQSRKATENELKLALWLSEQRKSFYDENLSHERSQKLNELGCAGFVVDDGTEYSESKSRCTPWETRFLEIQVYKDRFGNANPRETKRESFNGENKLGRWLREQRKKFVDGDLSVEQAQRLTDLGCAGFENDIHEPFASRSDSTSQNHHFQETYEDEFHASNYDSDSVQESQSQEFGSTVSVKSANGASINAVTWASKYQDLKAYKRQNGHANPKRARDVPEADYKLGAWLSSQRVKFRGGRLEADRIRKLHALGCAGFEEDSPRAKGRAEGKADLGYASLEETYSGSEPIKRKTWEAHYLDLQAYKARHGHAVPQQVRGSQPELVRWLTDQRFKYRRGSLADEKAQMLRAAGCKGFEEAESPPCGITEPQGNDVVLGRGGGTNTWPGNINYRTLVRQRQSEYNKKKKHKKLEVAKDVVRQIRSKGGRFLKEDPEGGWIDVGDAHAIKKTSQALREMKPDGILSQPSKASPTSTQQGRSGYLSSDIDSSDAESGDGLEYDSDSSNSLPPRRGSLGRRQSFTHKRKESAPRRESFTQKRKEAAPRRESFTQKRTVMSWDDHFQNLQLYKAKNGHVNVGCSRGPDYRTGHWLADQRYKFRRGDLNQEKGRKLYDLGCSGFEGVEDAEDGSDAEKMDYDSDSSREAPPQKQSSPGRSQQKSSRKRRFGVLTPPASTTRSGRQQKKKVTDDYFFY